MKYEVTAGGRVTEQRRRPVRRRKPIHLALDLLAMGMLVGVFVALHSYMNDATESGTNGERGENDVPNGTWTIGIGFSPTVGFSADAPMSMASKLTASFGGVDDTLGGEDVQEDLVLVVRDDEDGGEGEAQELRDEGSDLTESESTTDFPNIAFVYIDDQGYNDMGPQSTDLADFTPEISRLAGDGIWLSNYYGQQVCTPSRAALLTGLYPIHTGMNHGFISGNDPWGLPLKHSLMPQYLKEVVLCCFVLLLLLQKQVNH